MLCKGKTSIWVAIFGQHVMLCLAYTLLAKLLGPDQIELKFPAQEILESLKDEKYQTCFWPFAGIGCGWWHRFEAWQTLIAVLCSLAKEFYMSFHPYGLSSGEKQPRTYLNLRFRNELLVQSNATRLAYLSVVSTRLKLSLICNKSSVDQ